MQLIVNINRLFLYVTQIHNSVVVTAVWILKLLLTLIRTSCVFPNRHAHSASKTPKKDHKSIQIIIPSYGSTSLEKKLIHEAFPTSSIIMDHSIINIICSVLIDCPKWAIIISNIRTHRSLRYFGCKYHPIIHTIIITGKRNCGVYLWRISIIVPMNSVRSIHKVMLFRELQKMLWYSNHKQLVIASTDIIVYNWSIL